MEALCHNLFPSFLFPRFPPRSHWQSGVLLLTADCVVFVEHHAGIGSAGWVQFPPCELGGEVYQGLEPWGAFLILIFFAFSSQITCFQPQGSG